MPERVLTTRRLNRALLARQHLLERAEAPLETVLERVAGIQNQYAPSAYFGLWTRMAGLGRAGLTAAYDRRSVVQGTLMRSTIHAVAAGDYWPFAAAVRRHRRDWWLRAMRQQGRQIDVDAAMGLVAQRLAAGPARAAELKKLLAAAGQPDFSIAGIHLFLDIVRVPPSGTWESRRADLYGLASDWLPGPQPSEEEGLERVLLRYLGAFGPASLKDVAGWAGVPATVLRPIAGRLDLTRYRDEAGAVLFDLPEAALPDAGEPAPVRFIPPFDSIVWAHARRADVVPERFRPLILNPKLPHMPPPFLVDGAVAGTWKVEGEEVRLTPFEDLPRRVMKELGTEGLRLAAFHSLP